MLYRTWANAQNEHLKPKNTDGRAHLEVMTEITSRSSGERRVSACKERLQRVEERQKVKKFAKEKERSFLQHPQMLERKMSPEFWWKTS